MSIIENFKYIIRHEVFDLIQKEGKQGRRTENDRTELGCEGKEERKEGRKDKKR